MSDELTLYLIVRGDLGLGPEHAGKMLGQAMHAADSTIELADPNLVKLYHSTPFRRKIALKIPNEEGLRALAERCRALGFPHYLVTDFGRTVFETHTVTCLGIGPLTPKQANKKLNLQGLPLYKEIT